MAATNIGEKMKIKLTLAVAVIGLSGCANIENPREAIANTLYGPARPSESDIHKMADLAWPKHQDGLSIDAACAAANKQLGLRSRNPSYGTAKCQMSLREKSHAESSRRQKETEDRKRLAQQQRRAEEFDRRIASIRANQSEIYTEAEARVIYDALDGQHLAERPLVKPDNKKYVVSGFIDPSGGLQSDHFLMRTTEYGASRYAHVYLHRGAELPPQAHAESRVFIVGTYIANKPYQTVIGQHKSMPIFQAEFVRVVN